MINEYLPKLFSEAESIKNWSDVLEILRVLSKTGRMDQIPDWLAVEMVWMSVQFEQLRYFNQPSDNKAIDEAIISLKTMDCWKQIIAFDQHFPLLDQQYLHEQGIDIEINTLSQFLGYSGSKAISPHRLFNINRYITIEKLNLNHQYHPLVHFFRYSSGLRDKSSSPNHLFNCDWYRENYLQGQPFKNPLLHYLDHFHEPGIQPIQCFNNDYVRKTQQLSADTDPLAYYIKQVQIQGVYFRQNGFSPCPYFDRAFYLASYPDIKIATENNGLDPFGHFCTAGIKEHRKGHPWLRQNMATPSMVEKFSANRRLAVLILGMHRSGTSAVTRMTNLLGLDVTTDLMPPTPANPTGYWESVELRELHDEILSALGSSWDDILPINADIFQTPEIDRYKFLLTDYIVRTFSGSQRFVIKDPRMCNLMPLWLGALEGLNVELRVIMPYRHPLEVAKSLQNREGFTLEKSFLLWLRHILNAERHTRGIKRCFVSYSQALTNPEKVIQTISGQCEIDVPNILESEKQVKGFLDGQHYHQRITDTDLSEADFPSWVSQVFEILDKWSAHKDDGQRLQGQFNRISDEMARADSLYGNIIRDKNNDLKQVSFMQRQTEKQGRQLTAQINKLFEQEEIQQIIRKTA
ncbi:MAG: hypothetical protein WAW36_08670 [Methylovulum miyakonense]|uniref:sulfotransferase family protein n=1 Tax=Methylovulum miyakonense TaxID=645578 RepID=UPI003BB4B779